MYPILENRYDWPTNMNIFVSKRDMLNHPVALLQLEPNEEVPLPYQESSL
ncbi:hypothetical protein M7I_6764 [Glarea lozoyensis 74030]|uniref:Uncharacterized protein n=1 Tax=Glarea lozoyensis (strain ATCC 74030 / MF5533) TaxID=1104152 RepID=H0EVG6_GLAL7|nr:hypothetical protein M7I_6764 [Glarea lozoyensis 74030]